MQRLDLKWTVRMDQLLIWSQLISLAVVGSANAAWQYNDEQYAKAQYDKFFRHAHGQSRGHDQLEPFQYQYVDYQPKCGTGGPPVCATNGTSYFYFENNCKLEAANMKLLFQYSTELEPTELERCLPQCDNIICNKTYAPVCAVGEPGAKQDRGVTFANECEAHRRGCLTKQTMRILRKGPCRDARLKSRPASKGKGKRKHGRRRTTTTTTTAAATATTATTAATPSNRRHIYVRLANKRSRTTSTTTKSTTSTTTPAPMQFHRYMNLGNPHVSVSRAVHAYSVYNIPDVGLNYDAIRDSSLSLYVPGVGTITDTPPSTTSTRTTTITPEPQSTTSTTARPSTTETAKTRTAPREEFKFFYVPYGTTSTTTVSSGSISEAPEVASTTATIADSIAARWPVGRTASTASTTKGLKLGIPDVARNATGFKAKAATSPKPEIPKPHPKPNVLKN
ncbi:mucin-5AC [Drosophila montana]|uniref:mucin-5AC n=1 Tax=Drosophila montana TaxID=40370 RepID=UPI00313A92B8